MNDLAKNAQVMEEEENPLLLWVAYLPSSDDGNKKNYLSDGKGHIRIFKTEDSICEYLKGLKPLMSEETHSAIVVHSVQGQIAVPEDGEQQIQLTGPSNVLNSNPIPISTLAPLTVPTASEQLDTLLKRRKIRRRK